MSGGRSAAAMSATRSTSASATSGPASPAISKWSRPARPYYRSTYMFVTRKAANLDGLTLDDPRLKKLQDRRRAGRRRCQQHAAGACAFEPGDHRQRPRLHALRRLSKPNPPAAIVEAVERGDVDVALVWGPLAGYFAARSPVPLRLEPVTPWIADMQWPMQSRHFRRRPEERPEAAQADRRGACAEVGRHSQAPRRLSRARRRGAVTPKQNRRPNCFGRRSRVGQVSGQKS